MTFYLDSTQDNVKKKNRKVQKSKQTHKRTVVTSESLNCSSKCDPPGCVPWVCMYTVGTESL